jgi:hypothetical protein
MTTLSYRDVLSQTLDDKELVEFLVDRIHDYKTYGAFRVDKLPFQVTVTLVDKIKALMEQQAAFYNNGRANPPAAANDDDFNEKNPPSVAYSDAE